MLIFVSKHVTLHYLGVKGKLGFNRMGYDLAFDYSRKYEILGISWKVISQAPQQHSPSDWLKTT
jgi:hypothetical protein